MLAEKDAKTNRLTLSHKELLGTWSENAARFAPGMTVTGLVRSRKPYGTFIELTPNLAGLADQTEGIKENDAVAVYCKAIQPDRMKVKLNILQRLEKQQLLLPFSILSHPVNSPTGSILPQIGTAQRSAQRLIRLPL